MVWMETKPQTKIFSEGRLWNDLVLTIPWLVCLASKNIILALDHGNSWSLIIAMGMEVNGLPAVPRGTINQHKARMIKENVFLDLFAMIFEEHN